MGSLLLGAVRVIFHCQPLILLWWRAGEFEKHAGCWMGWPDSPYLWRESAKPAQEQYTAVAKAISQFEPLTMLANPEVSTHCVWPARCMLCCWVVPSRLFCAQLWTCARYWTCSPFGYK